MLFDEIIALPLVCFDLISWLDMAVFSAKCYILSNEASQEENDMEIGKCPNCHEMLRARDIENRSVKGGILTNYHAIVCKKCETIIGFII